MVFFAILGAADSIAGNRFGLGENFKEGILTMGPLTISMAGLLVLTPVISGFLGPVVTPLFQRIGADPSMFAGIFFAIDMGGAPLAKAMAADAQAAALGGIITGSMLGATIVFTIPVALGIVSAGDRKDLAKGVLTGMITIPLGVIAAGLLAGFPAVMVIKNTIPTAFISFLIALGMWKWEKILIKIFVCFGRFIVAVSMFGLAAGIAAQLTGYRLFEQMTSLKEVFLIIGNIAILLAGAFPLVYVLTRLLERFLTGAGLRLGINRVAASGFLVSMANSIPMFGMLRDMDAKGKRMNMAFAVSGAFVLGDHLGYTASYNPSMIVPLIVGKLTAGITAAALAFLLSKKDEG